MRIIAPSILAADFGHLDDEVSKINNSPAQWIHIDVMDGLFVPNISFGFPVFNAIRKASDKIMDVHLMIAQPHKYISRFAQAGADIITFHLESESNPQLCIDLIRQAGAKVGISIRPATPVSALNNLLPLVDMVLVMSVEPGFGGQAFMPDSLDKVRQLKTQIHNDRLETLIEVDGGISADNAGALFNAGAQILVAGSSVFRSDNYHQAITRMLEAQ